MHFWCRPALHLCSHSTACTSICGECLWWKSIWSKFDSERLRLLLNDGNNYWQHKNADIVLMKRFYHSWITWNICYAFRFFFYHWLTIAFLSWRCTSFQLELFVYPYVILNISTCAFNSVMTFWHFVWRFPCREISADSYGGGRGA